MNGTQIDRRAVLTGMASLATMGVAGAAEKYPSEPITLVVPSAAGFAADTVARLLAEHLSRAFAVSVAVDNKSEDGGIPAVAAVARAPADGHTLLMASSATHSAARALFKTVPYDPIKDFTPVARIAGVTTLIAVHPDLPAKSIRDLVALAKANPGKLQYGFGNPDARIAGAMLKSASGIDIVPVAYRDNAQAMADLLAGHIKVAATDLNTALLHLRAGKIRALAVATGRRSDIIPDIPTMSETVAPGFDVLSWYGMAGPAGLSKEIVLALAVALKRFVQRRDIRDRLLEMGTEVVWTGPQDMDRFMLVQQERWTGLVRGAGIAPQ